MPAHRRNVLSVAAAIVVAAAIPMQSHAALAVIDKANLTQNIQTAIHQVLSYIEMLEQVKQATKTNKNEFSLSATFGAGVEMEQFLGIMAEGQQMLNSLRQGQRAFNDIQNVFGASKYDSWVNFAVNISERRKLGDQDAMKLFDSAYAANAQIKKAYEANQKILRNVRNISGPTEGLQAAVNSLGVVIDQNSAMLLAMSSNNQMEAQKIEKDAIAKEEAERQDVKYHDGIMGAINRDIQILQGIGVRVNPTPNYR